MRKCIRFCVVNSCSLAVYPFPLVLKAARPFRYLVRFFSILFSPRAFNARIFFDVKVTDSRVLK